MFKLTCLKITHLQNTRYCFIEDYNWSSYLYTHILTFPIHLQFYFLHTSLPLSNIPLVYLVHCFSLLNVSSMRAGILPLMVPRISYVLRKQLQDE